MRRGISYLFIVLLTAPLICLAQNDSITRKPVIKVGTFYNNNLHYYGRTDSLHSAALIPMTEFWVTPSLYVNIAPVFIHNRQQALAYAGTVATAGIQLNREKSFTHIYFVKPFYKGSEQLPQSALKAQAAINHTWKSRVVNFTAGVDVKFSNNTDPGVTAGLDHMIRKELKNGSVLVIDPSFYLYAGTQRFTKTWYEKNNFLFFEGSAREQSKAINKFSLLSFEISMPVVYAKDKWLLLATPAFVTPQNLVSIEGNPDVSERGRNLFYITVGIKRTL